MNKLFAKIASITAGLALVAGAGVALASHADAKGVKAEDVTDLITANDLAASNTTYVDFSGVSKSSSAVYAGQSAKSNDGAIQMRSKNSNSGIVSTTSGGTVKSVTITVKSGSNTIEVYGKNTAYTSAANLYATSEGGDQGTKVGSVSATGTVTFTDSYEYVGIRSNSGAIYLTSISIVWDNGGGGGGGEEDPVLQSISVSNEKTSYTVGDEFVKPTVTAHFDKGSDQDVSASASCTGYNMGVAGEYTVTVSYGGKTTTYDITVSATEPTGDVLYSATFTEVGTHGYTQNKEFTLNEKDWVASVSQVNGGVFYLGCNSTHAAKGILKDNSSFSDVVAALAAEDTPYGKNTSTAHAYAMRFANAYENVGSVTFTWAGGNNAFQVYIFGDRGSGLEKLAHENYATSGATTSGSVSWSAEEYGENFDCFVIVARPGATDSTATSKTLRPATFQIVAGEEPIDPGLKTLSIEGPDSVKYQDVVDFTAKDGEDIVTSATWTTNDSTVLGVTDNGDGTATVEGLKDGSAKLIASADGYKNAEITLSVDIGSWKSLTISGSMTKTEYTSAEAWDPTGFTVTATTGYGYEKDVTSELSLSWTYDPAAPAKGVTSVVATAHYSELSKASSAQTVSVEVAHAGTAEDPFTVAEALAKCNEIGAVGNTGKGPWVTKGIISRVTSAPAATYWNATYYISDDGTQNNELQVYRGFYLDSAKFDATTALLMKAGMIVTVTGNLTGSYGSEYCQGNYLLSIEEPDTGDVDVTFEPSVTSYEIGATGTFVATSETSGAVITYSVDKSSVLSVDENTGAFEALGLGVARVTATASAGGKEGISYVDITVNGSTTLSVSEANAIAADVESGKTTSYYVYVEGYVAEFGTSMSGTSPRALDIMDESGNRIMVYTNVKPYASFIDGLSLGDHLKVKANVQNYNGTYELTNPEKVSSSYSAWSLAFEILSETDAVCNEYDGVTDNADAIAAKWETLGGEGHYASLNSAEKAKLIEGIAKEDGTTLEQALARYDYLTAKYDLDGFITDRAPSAGRYTPANLTVAEDSNVAIAVVAIVAVASISAIAVILIIKRRKAFDR